MAHVTKQETKRRPLTPAEKAEAAKVKAHYEARKKVDGLTQERLADLMGFKTQGAVSAYLRGDAAISNEVLLRFAHHLRFDPREVRPSILEDMHILDIVLSAEDDLDAEAREFARRFNALSEADRAAQSLREHWGLGTDPIPNLVELLEEQGIKVLSVDLTNIDGLTARVRRAQKGAVPVIVVNRKDWGERQRFTLGHEVGHMVMDVSAKVDDEKAAHRFAGAFLMPADALWAEIGRHRTSIGGRELFYLKQLFGVSVQAITYRCKDLGIFSESLFRRLFHEFSRLGWRSPPYKEPYARSAEEPTRFKRLTLRALAEGAISEPKAAELLGLTVRELNQRMEVEPPVEPQAAEA